MISEKFVAIAREVIKFIRDGNKLVYGRIICNSSHDGYHCLTSCPLGSVCVNSGLSIKLEYNDPELRNLADYLYKYAQTKLKLSEKFISGFDDSSISSSYDDEWVKSGSEDYKIGFYLGNQCKKRGWIV